MLSKEQALGRLKVDILLRGLAQGTERCYSKNVEAFLDWSGKSVEELNEIDVRAFLEHLIAEKKLKPPTVNTYSAAIRFFFAVTLNRTMNYLQIPRCKVPKKLPDILTRDEIAKLISLSSSLKHRALLLLAYGSGLRVSELVSVKIKDIDSEAMRLFVCGGKGKKDRYTILSETALIEMRKYWLRYRPKSPDGFLFPGSKNTGHLGAKSVERALRELSAKARISKNVTPHTLRHCFATHLLEDGCNIFQIKEMMGHASLASTAVYLHLVNSTADVTSPADRMPKLSEGPSI